MQVMNQARPSYIDFAEAYYESTATGITPKKNKSNEDQIHNDVAPCAKSIQSSILATRMLERISVDDCKYSKTSRTIQDGNILGVQLRCCLRAPTSFALVQTEEGAF